MRVKQVIAHRDVLVNSENRAVINLGDCSVLTDYAADFSLGNYDFIYRVGKVRKLVHAVIKNGKRNFSYYEGRMLVVVSVSLCVYLLSKGSEKVGEIV